MLKYLLSVICLCLTNCYLCSQNTIRGVIYDGSTGEELIGASVILEGTATGTVTDWDGSFVYEGDFTYPVVVDITFIGFTSQKLTISDDKRVKVTLEADAQILEAVTVKGRRVSDKILESPLTVESLDIIAIKETPASNFYEGLGSLKDVDLTSASLGFKVINMRGFNSTSPVRSLQLIDGVDNQSPGLNFSLGNFLGAPELDINKVELVIGASSAFYGPNAFNGVISMESKDPYYHKGLSASVKVGERNLLELGIRYADALKNKNGDEFMAYKLNLYGLKADDWEAENYGVVYGTDTLLGPNNPGGYDAVNIYGDEYQSRNDLTSADPWTFGPIGAWSRTGYREVDMVDYNSENIKANVGFQFRLNPAKKEQSTELLVSSSYGFGTTVYQGDNRFSLRNIKFFQNKLELRKRNKFFLRVYATHEDAGDSYDPYFTSLRLLDSAKRNTDWSKEYEGYWRRNIKPRVDELGYPQIEITIGPRGEIISSFDREAAAAWAVEYNDSLVVWHQECEDIANMAGENNEINVAFFEPGTERFNQKFDEIVSKKRSDGGTLFFDKSALYHAQGEYHFNPGFFDKWRVGFSSRLYKPNTEGTIFIDTAGRKISNFEYGFYTGGEKHFIDGKLRLQGSLRMDKNENFDLLYSPAASIIYNPHKNHFLRGSFSSAIRNPTLSDQYLNLNVGPAILSGNLNGAENLVTVESFLDYIQNGLEPDRLDSFNIDPIQPEKVRTFEIGYRTTVAKSIYLDMGYYYSTYRDFIGYKVGIDAEYDPLSNFPTTIQAYRYSTNAEEVVTTQGFSIGANFFFMDYFGFNGNYSWNKLNSESTDPVVPAFNTPEHKYNVGLSARNIPMNLFGGKTDFGFNVTYKWVQGFIFEGSPQFSGPIEDYGLLDGQINFKFPKINTTLKIGATNLLNNLHYETYGGPEIGRFAYASLLYEFKKQ